ncbi:MAG: CoA-binding protein [Bdellovibrionales bacterium]|nr:CoA-binding protein [Bdellovibrionales bacterium]
MSKKTLVLGASENPDRYSNKAVRELTKHGHSVVAVGKKAGLIDIGESKTVEIEPKERIGDQCFDTVTLYLNPSHQEEYRDLILKLKPKRVLFNPGAENAEFKAQLQKYGIQTEEACTLVLLRTNQY